MSVHRLLRSQSCPCADGLLDGGLGGEEWVPGIALCEQTSVVQNIVEHRFGVTQSLLRGPENLSSGGAAPLRRGCLATPSL
jgi:hypothetical protein